MSKKTKQEEWAEKFQDMFNEYLEEFPDTDIVFCLSNYDKNEDEDPDTMFMVFVGDNNSFYEILNSLNAYYSSYTNPILNINISEYLKDNGDIYLNSFKDEYKNIDAWIDKDTGTSKN